MSETGMIEVRLKYLYRDVDRHGNERLYFWRKGGPKIRIRETQDSEAFLTVYKDLLQAAERGEQALPNGRRETIQLGTWRWLCVAYFGSAEFKRLDPRTQRVRRRTLELTFDEVTVPGGSIRFADFPISRLTPKRYASSATANLKPPRPPTSASRLSAGFLHGRSLRTI